MNKTISSLLFKLLWYFMAGWLTFGFMGENMFMWLIILAVVTTIINYVIGDRFLLPRMGALPSAIVDGFMALLIAYLFDLFTDTFFTSFLTLIIFGVIIALAEYFYHQYLVKERRTYARR